MDELFPYTPRKTKFEVLDATFVARHFLLDEMKSTIKEQAGADTLQHWMVLGTRGMGKSHLITMIYHIVKKDPSYNAQWIPVLMNEEEQGVFSLPTLFVRIVTKLADELERTDKGKAKRVHACLEELRRGRGSPENVLEDSVTFLKDFVAETGKRLLVLVENADDLFTKCMPNKNEVKKFRKMLQHENYLLLIATSPTFFEGIKSRKGVLYDFFRTRRLDLLSYEESVALLRRWATVSGDDDLLKEFVPDDYRLRVLYHLTGGNPRILMFLYMAISEQKKMESAVAIFRTLLEKDLSNYYLSRLRDIPNQEQPIVIALAESSSNLTQTEIAEKTFLPMRSIGTFMVRLENAGLVRPVSEKKGKNTLYTLTDHMFRLWYQWRTSLREKEVIEAIVEFLSIWYKRHELESWAHGEGIYAEHAREALKFRETDRFKGYIEIFQVGGKEALLDYFTDKNYHAALDTIDFLKECGVDASEVEPALLEAIKKCDTLEDVEKCYLALAEHHTDNVRAYLEIGAVFFDKENYVQAEEALTKALSLDPQSVIAWYSLGLTRERQDHYEGAEEAYLKATTLTPKNAEAWRALGCVKCKRKDPLAAEEAFSRSVELDPKNADALKRLGHVLSFQKNYASAEEVLSRAIELDPRDSEALILLARVRADQKNYAGAEEACTKAKELDPKDAEAWKLLGAASNNLKNYASAEEALIKAVELNPKDATAWKFLGNARYNQKKYAAAEEAYANSVSLDPKNAQAWAWLGSARNSQANYSGAKEALSKAVELDPANVDIRTILSAVNFMNYHFDECMNTTLKGLEFNKKIYSLLDMLCELEVRVKKVPNLLELFDRYLNSVNTDAVSKVYLYFYRALIFLHRKDFTPFKSDLQAGIALMKSLTNDDRRNVQGKVIDFLIGVIYGEYLDEIKTYIETLKEIAPEIAQVFFPLDNVIEYFEAYLADHGNGKKVEISKAIKRAEATLDQVPMELRGPVEEMIQTVKKNMKWWAKRPKE